MAYPILYILMRTDMDSMNPGKAMAQASHASNQYVNDVQLGCTTEQFRQDWHTWAHYNGFGTVVVLAVSSERELQSQIKNALSEDFFCGVVHDPTYPIKDGKVIHKIPVDTCGYIMVPDMDERRPSNLSELSLHS